MFFCQKIYSPYVLLFFCPKKQFTTDKLLLFLDKRTEEQKKQFLPNPLFPYPSFILFVLLSPKNIFPLCPFVLLSKKITLSHPLCSFVQKTYPPYALLSKITQNPPVAFPPLSISIGSLPAATPVSASHNPRQYPFPAFPNGSRNPPTFSNHPH